MILSNKKEVVKHSSAIQISNEINLLQRRAWNVLLANAYNDLPHKDVYEIRVKDLANVLRFDSKNIDYLKKSLKILNVTQVEWNILKKDGETDWGVYTLLAQVNIVNGVCYYAYAPYLRKQLNNPLMYAKINLRLQNRFKSKHALALYELAVDYYRVSDKYGETPFITIEKFRKLLGLKDREYPQFKILSRDIIKKATKEINKKSDLSVEVEYRKKGRKVVALKFCIKKNFKNIIDIEPIEKIVEEVSEQKALPLPEFEIDNQALFESMTTEFGLSRNKVIEILTTKDELYIQEVLDVVRDQVRAGKVKNIPAFTVRALEDDYRRKKTEAEIEKEKQIELKKKAEEEEAFIEKLREEFDEQYKKEIKLLLDSMEEEEKDSLIKRFEEDVINNGGNKILKRNYSKKGIDAPSVQAYFRSYVAKERFSNDINDFKFYAEKKGVKVKKNNQNKYVIDK